MVDRVEHQLHAGRNAQLVEDPKQILLDRVFAQHQRAGDLAIAQTLGDECNNLFLPRGEKILSSMIHHPQSRPARDSFEHVIELLSIGPDLSAGHAVNTFAQQAQVGFVGAENSPRRSERR